MLSLKLKASATFLSFGVRQVHGINRIGNRDIVGHGCNGSYVYKDDPAFPFPAIRFKENCSNIQAIRQKEKGDWKHLSIDDKKALYRASFCQTFSEFQHFTGQWKFILGWVFFTTSFGFWAMMFAHFFINNEKLPKTFDEERRQAQLKRMLDARVNPIDGLSSRWDYKNGRWKSFIE